MDISKIESARSLKASLQAAVATGELENKQQLLDRARDLGLTVTRNGADYVGLLCDSGQRFRIRFELPSTCPVLANEVETKAYAVARPSGYWIYSLIAHSRDGARKACYVGQTVNLKRRFREHLRRHRPGRCSSALIEWAAREQVEIRATVLSLVEGSQSYATQFEGYWLRLAIEAGFEAPDSHNWGRLPQPLDPVGQPNCWPTDQVLTASFSLVDLVEQEIIPIELYVASTSSEGAPQSAEDSEW
ncbi:GIY-YIG nuclease family protein [Pseudomonas brassicacearum]|uniref:GIY-YIG nuclease family protein n=1 Tax=Pseudomonas brassicacearum TaxID=930166 RepID=UPI000F48D4E6|nr:GIY-YIG nuclease family protein [Pseudomonas brassicacearum]